MLILAFNFQVSTASEFADHTLGGHVTPHNPIRIQCQVHGKVFQFQVFYQSKTTSATGKVSLPAEKTSFIIAPYDESFVGEVSHLPGNVLSSFTTTTHGCGVGSHRKQQVEGWLPIISEIRNLLSFGILNRIFPLVLSMLFV